MSAPVHDIEAIRAAVGLQALCEADGIVFVREGSNWKASCPFHSQQFESFTIHGTSPQRAYCYGCGWSGDIFAYWAESRGLSSNDKDGFRAAVEALALRAGQSPLATGAKKRKEPAAEVRREKTLDDCRKPWLPRMRQMREDELRDLSVLRGIGMPALRAAVADGRLGFSWWPVSRETGGWDMRSHASWVITDASRWCAQFRRLDGGLYEGRDGNHFKSYSTKNVCWPVGAGQVEGRDRIVLVEGGADMLAAYALAMEAGVLEEVCIWGVFGASVRICREALEAAKGKRVRIFADNDKPQTKVFKNRPPLVVRPGHEGAARWCAQFQESGAASVDVYDLEPLGEDVGDLNDVVKAGLDDVDVKHFFDF